VVSQVLALKPFQLLVLFDRDAGPLPVDEVCENGIFPLALDLVFFPVVAGGVLKSGC
jgi:hypothetical protein